MLCFEHGMLVSLSGFLSSYKTPQISTKLVQFADLKWSFQQGHPSFFLTVGVFRYPGFLLMFLILFDSVTSARVTAKYHSIKLQYREQMHNVFDLLGQLKSKLSLWRGPYGSQESVLSLLQDWHVCGHLEQSLLIANSPWVPFRMFSFLEKQFSI